MKRAPISIHSWDWFFLSIASLVIVITRWLYHSQYLFHWDSVQFALSFSGINVLEHRPHPPGYLFYILLGKGMKLITGDDNTAMILLGIIASIVALWFVYYLAIKIFGNRLAGIIAGILFVFNIIVAFHGMVAEVYIVEAAWALGVLTLFYLYWEKPSLNRLVIAVIFLGLLGGIRQSAEISLLPLLIYLLITTTKSWKHWLISAGVLLVTNLLWLIPLTFMSGGLVSYLSSFKSLSSVVLLRDIAKLGWWGKIADNLRIIAQALSLVLAWELVAGYLGLSSWLVHRETQTGSSKILRFWLIAGIGLFGLVALTLMTNPGYVLLPVILLLIGIGGGLSIFYQRLQLKVSRPISTLILGAILFLLTTHQIYSFFTLEPEDFAFISPSYKSISIHDELIGSLISGVKKNGPASTTAIWVDSPQTMLFFDIRHLQYYLPGYDIYRYAPESLVRPKDQVIWHANGYDENYQEKVRLDSTVKKLVIIRPFWNELHEEHQIPLRISKERHIVYYDLETEEVRRKVAERYNFTVE